MEIVSLFIAIFLTFILINFTVAEIVNGKFNANDAIGETNRSKIKIYITFLVSLFWTIIIYYMKL